MSTEVRQFTVQADDDGVRLDRWFKRHLPQVGFATVSRWARTGQVRVDGKRADPADRVSTGQVIRVPPGGENTETVCVPRMAAKEGLRLAVNAVGLIKVVGRSLPSQRTTVLDPKPVPMTFSVVGGFVAKKAVGDTEDSTGAGRTIETVVGWPASTSDGRSPLGATIAGLSVASIIASAPSQFSRAFGRISSGGITNPYAPVSRTSIVKLITPWSP